MKFLRSSHLSPLKRILSSKFSPYLVVNSGYFFFKSSPTPQVVSSMS